MSEEQRVAPAPGPADVGIVAALAIEVADFVEGLKSVRRYQSAVAPVTEGEHGEKIVAVAVCGAGREMARRATEALVSGHRPRIIIAAGFAGALDPGLSRNDLVLPDLVIDREGSRYQIDLPAKLTPQVKHTRGTLLTVDQVVLRAAEKAELRTVYDADVVDMESHAVAAACSARQVPFLAIRVISDDALTDLPREIASVISGRGSSYRAGAALRAVWQRPASVKDFWRLYEHAIEAAGRLSKFISSCVDQI